MHAVRWYENVKARDKLEDLNLDGGIDPALKFTVTWLRDGRPRNRKLGHRAWSNRHGRDVYSLPGAKFKYVEYT
jgi:hypothetical protein